MSKSSHPYAYHHSLQILVVQGFQWLLDVQMIGDAPDLRDCPFIVIFRAIIRPHAFLEMIKIGMRSGFEKKKSTQFLSKLGAFGRG